MFIEAGMRRSAEGFRLLLDPETCVSWQPAGMWEAAEKSRWPMLIVRALIELRLHVRESGVIFGTVRGALAT